MRLPFPAAVALMAVVVYCCGCGTQFDAQADGNDTPNPDPAHRAEEVRDADPHSVRIDSDLLPDSADGGQDSGVAVDSDARQPAARNPIVRGLQQLIDGSPASEELQSLESTLSEADAILTRVKEENRAALQNAGRQVPRRGAPNIVLIVADQLGVGDLSCYGQQAYETSQIDALAQEGVRFENAYAGSPEPLISQWSLVTGLNSLQVRNRRERANMGWTLADMLWHAGFDTGFVGSWHGSAEKQFREIARGLAQCVIGFQADEDPLYPAELWTRGARVGLPANTAGKRGLHAQDFYLLETQAFLKDHADESRPFFLQVSLPLPGAVGVITDGETRSPEALEQNFRKSIERLDQSIGTIREQLDELGLADRTLMIVTSTAGPAEPEIGAIDRTGGLKYVDGNLHEGRLRIPLIAWGPSRVNAGEVIGSVCTLWDLFPTFSGLAGATRRPQSPPGLSLQLCLRGRELAERDLLYWETRESGFGQAVRMGKWKALRSPGSQDVQLFNLEKDPSETQDVADEHPDIVARAIRG